MPSLLFYASLLMSECFLLPIKNCTSVLTHCLVILFCLCLLTSTFPPNWKHANTVPNNGDRSKPSNYRPISLLSCLSKAYKTILNREALKHLSAFDLLTPPHGQLHTQN